MFATMAEAEKAQALLRRFGSTESWLVHPHTLAVALGVGHGQTVRDWEELADFLLARQPEGDDRRTEKLTEAREHLRVAKQRLGWGRDATGREIISDLTYALDCLLEALA